MRIEGIRSTHARSGFMIVDALLALFILGALISMLGYATNLRQRNINHLADQRIALHRAQEALAQLQSSGPATTQSDPDTNISVHRSGRHVGDLEWIEVTATFNGRHAALTGLAKPAISAAAPTTAPGGAP